MPPPIKKIQRLSKAKTRVTLDAEKRIMGRSKALQAKLSSYLVDTFLPSLEIDDNGNIRNTVKNLKKVNNPTKLKTFIRKTITRPLLAIYNASFVDIGKRSTDYYKTFNVTDAATSRIFGRAEISQEEYLLNLFDNNEVLEALKKNIRNGVRTSQPYSDLRTLMKEQVKGSEEKQGVLQSFHRRNGIEEFQTYSRTLDQDFSKALNLNYAIYSGTEIQTTRTFCDERVGNVYTREEVLEWTGLDWSGKKANHQILVDLGGWNCRHDLVWVSYEVAKQLRSDIQRSKFDK